MITSLIAAQIYFDRGNKNLTIAEYRCVFQTTLMIRVARCGLFCQRPYLLSRAILLSSRKGFNCFSIISFNNFESPGNILNNNNTLGSLILGMGVIKNFIHASEIKRRYNEWVRADESEYIYQFEIYTDKIDNKTEINLAKRVVMNFSESFEDC